LKNKSRKRKKAIEETAVIIYKRVNADGVSRDEADNENRSKKNIGTFFRAASQMRNKNCGVKTQ